MRALEKGTLMGQVLLREERDVDEALRRIREASDAESVGGAARFRNFLKKVRRRLEEEDTAAEGGLGAKLKELRKGSASTTKGRGAAASEDGGAGPTEHPLFGIDLTPREEATFRLDGGALGPDEALELLQLAHQKNEETRGNLLLAELRLHEASMAVLDAFHTAFNDLCDKRKAFLDNTLNESVSLEDWFGKNSREHVISLVERYAEDPETAAPQLPKQHLSKHNVRDPRILAVIRSENTADAAAQRAVDDAKAAFEAAKKSGAAQGSGTGSEAGTPAADGMGSAGGAGDEGTGGEDGGNEDEDEGTRVGVRLQDMPDDLAAMLGDRDTADGMIAAAAEARLGQVFAVLDEVKKYDADER